MQQFKDGAHETGDAHDIMTRTKHSRAEQDMPILKTMGRGEGSKDRVLEHFTGKALEEHMASEEETEGFGE